MPHEGWHQLAFSRDVPQGLSEASLGGRPIALVREGDDVRAFDAACPHRGANLCRGGTLVRDAIRCPFHALAIGLSDASATPLRATAFPCLSIGGLVFVRLPGGEEGGLTTLLTSLDASAFFVPGFALDLAAPAALVIENAFDALHFQPVHAIGRVPDLRIVEEGATLVVEGRFALPPSSWQTAWAGKRFVDVPYRATAYSPTVVVTELGGAAPYTMITATNPVTDRSCNVRLSLVLPAGSDGRPPSATSCRYLLDGARRGLLEDAPIWEGIVPDPPFRPMPGDEPVTAFRRLCERFR